MSSGPVKLMHKEKREICPYNPAHSIDPLRMSIHLMKCKKQYPNMKMSICPFNATHHVRDENLSSHLKECKDKDVVERSIFIREYPDVFHYHSKSSSSEEEIININNDTREEWDVQSNTSSYNPEKNIVYKEIARQTPTGLGKAGRRLWRQVDMHRIERLKEGQPIEDLVYPKPDGGEISIYEIVNGSRKGEDSLPDLDRCTLQTPPPRPPTAETSKLRRPRIFSTKIAANIFEGIQESDNESTTTMSDNFDLECMSDVSSIGSKSSASSVKRDRQQYLNILKTMKIKESTELKLRDSDTLKPPRLNASRNDNGCKSSNINFNMDDHVQSNDSVRPKQNVGTARRMILNSLKLC